MAERMVRIRTFTPPKRLPAQKLLLEKLLLVLGALLVFGVFNWSILQKETVLREGRVVRLALAPVDPRAFMTGDYMALNYDLAAQVSALMSKAGQGRSRDAFAVVSADASGVAQLLRMQDRATPVADGEMALKVRLRQGGARLGSDAFHFQEGTAKRYQAARYGEFRVDRSGEMLLVRLLDESLTPLQANQ
jgi:uncharacterized membrane-anchored protein